MARSYALINNRHHYKSRLTPIQIIGLHVTAGLEDLDMLGIDHSAEKTNAWGATTDTQVSWHACSDSDSIGWALPDTYTAFHIRGYNSEALGLEICNRTATWNDKPKEWVERTLRNAAKVCHEWEKAHNIPRRLLTKAQVDAGMKGYTYHMFLDPTRRRDPGADFPWQQFVGYLEELDGKTVFDELEGGNMWRVVVDKKHQYVWCGAHIIWIRSTMVHGKINTATGPSAVPVPTVHFTQTEFEQFLKELGASAKVGHGGLKMPQVDPVVVVQPGADLKTVEEALKNVLGENVLEITISGRETS
jgi:hypothetical protein